MFLSSLALGGLSGDVGGSLEGLGFGSFDDAGSLLGKANDFWGSFTGTSAEVFANAGKNAVKQLKQSFQANFITDPSSALTSYEYGLNHAKGRFTAALSNSSQSKTKIGNKASLDDVIKSISELKTFISSKSKDYNFKVLRTENDSNKVGKHIGNYSWNVYEVTKKEGVKTTSKSLFTSFTDSTGQLYDQPQQKNNNIIIIAIVGGLLLFGKKLFK